MNERINNLRLDAGISQLKDDPRLVVIDREGNVIDPLVGLEKFAELIVQECIDTVLDCSVEYATRPQIAEELKEHFGVEE
jgi:hypothetical protein